MLVPSPSRFLSAAAAQPSGRRVQRKLFLQRVVGERTPSSSSSGPLRRSSRSSEWAGGGRGADELRTSFDSSFEAGAALPALPPPSCSAGAVLPTALADITSTATPYPQRGSGRRRASVRPIAPLPRKFWLYIKNGQPMTVEDASRPAPSVLPEDASVIANVLERRLTKEGDGKLLKTPDTPFWRLKRPRRKPKTEIRWGGFAEGLGKQELREGFEARAEAGLMAGDGGTRTFLPAPGNVAGRRQLAEREACAERERVERERVLMAIREGEEQSDIQIGRMGGAVLSCSGVDSATAGAPVLGGTRGNSRQTGQKTDESLISGPREVLGRALGGWAGEEDVDSFWSEEGSCGSGTMDRLVLAPAMGGGESRVSVLDATVPRGGAASEEEREQTKLSSSRVTVASASSTCTSLSSTCTSLHDEEDDVFDRQDPLPGPSPPTDENDGPPSAAKKSTRLPPIGSPQRETDDVLSCPLRAPRRTDDRLSTSVALAAEDPADHQQQHPRPTLGRERDAGRRLIAQLRQSAAEYKETNVHPDVVDALGQALTGHYHGIEKLQKAREIAKLSGEDFFSVVSSPQHASTANFNLLIRNRVMGRNLEQAFAIHDQMRQHGFEADADTYTSFIMGAMQLSEHPNPACPKLARSLYLQMRENLISPSPKIFGALMKCHTRHQELGAALGFLEKCEDEYPDFVSIVHYTIMVDGYVEHRQFEKAWDMFHNCRTWKAERGQPDEVMFTVMIKA